MLNYLFRLMFAWVVQGATTPTGFRPVYLRWLVVFLVVVVAALVLLGVIPGDNHLVWVAILLLSLALAVP